MRHLWWLLAVGCAPEATVPIDGDGDGYSVEADCDDSDADVAPLAVERCNGVDDDCDGAIDIDRAGIGVCSQTHTLSVQVDLLMVWDNTADMLDNQNRMVDQLPSFLDALSATGIDYHLGFTDMSVDTGTGGKLREARGVRWLEHDTPDAWQVGTQMLSMGSAGGIHERGRDAAWRALNRYAQPGAHNDGFRRADAFLDVLYFTNEDDSSTAIPIREYLDEVQGLVEAPTQHHAFIALDRTCGTARGDHYAGYADASGGTVHSVCDARLADRVLDALDRHHDRTNGVVHLGVDVRPETLQARVETLQGRFIEYPAAVLEWDAVAQSVTLPEAFVSGETLQVFYAEL